MAEAANTISDYIWCYYQTVRPYSFNDYLTPLEKEKRYFNQNLLLGVLNQLTTTHKGGGYGMFQFYCGLTIAIYLNPLTSYKKQMNQDNKKSHHKYGFFAYLIIGYEVTLILQG